MGVVFLSQAIDLATRSMADRDEFNNIKHLLLDQFVCSVYDPRGAWSVPDEPMGRRAAQTLLGANMTVVRHADLMVVFWRNVPSVGVPIEIFLRSESALPTILIDQDGTANRSAMLRALNPVVVTQPSELLRHIEGAGILESRNRIQVGQDNDGDPG